jgi:hypothetical protein
MYTTDWSASPRPQELDRLLLNRIEAHGRLAEAAPGSREWEAAVAYLEEIESLLRLFRTKPLALATA